MKRIAVLFAALCCVFAVAAQSEVAKVATSLAERTGCKYLYEAMCVSQGRILFVSEYRNAATFQAAYVGLTYDGTASGNTAILHAIPAHADVQPLQREANGVAAISVVHSSTSPEMTGECTASLELGYTPDSVVVLLDGATVLSAPREIVYIGYDHVAVVRDTVEVQTAVEVPTDHCPCGEYVSIETMRENYMAYGELIRRETDSYRKRLLIACRIRMGEIVRSDWRYGRYSIEASERTGGKPSKPSFGGGQTVRTGYLAKNKTKAPSVAASHRACKKEGTR